MGIPSTQASGAFLGHKGHTLTSRLVTASSLF